MSSLSGRFLILTVVFVMLAEVMIFVPSVARFREEYLMNRLERSQIAALAVLASNDMVSDELTYELLENAEVLNVVLNRDSVRQLVLSHRSLPAVSTTVDLRTATNLDLIGQALSRLWRSEAEVIRVIGAPTNEGGDLIEVTMETLPLRAAMIDYGLNILWLSLVISVVTATLLFLAVRRFLVRPIKRLVDEVMAYAEAPEDARRIIEPAASVRELRDAEVALQSMETQLTGALKQKDRLAQLGSAVAKISHDLRNILSVATLLADRLEESADPAVARNAPKLIASIARAVNLCEGTLAFGRAQEAPPAMTRVGLAELIEDILQNERLADTDGVVEVCADVPPGLQPRMDPDQIFRAVSNLTRNARQAMTAQGGGKLAVRAGEDDAAWWIEVCDTGPGLPMKAREHIFEPFRGTARKGGTGLGLAIAAELVRGHGGTLDLVRSDGSGTVFRIVLPKEIAA